MLSVGVRYSMDDLAMNGASGRKPITDEWSQRKMARKLREPVPDGSDNLSWSYGNGGMNFGSPATLMCTELINKHTLQLNAERSTGD
jgi:hypothetical protein